MKNIKSSSFDNNLIHPIMLQNSGPNTKLTVLDLFNMCWIESIRSWGFSKIIFVKKADKNPLTLHQVFDPSLYPECEWAKPHEKSRALLNVDIEKALDSVWLDNLIYKLKNLKINGNMTKMIDAFLRLRKRNTIT